MLDFENDIFDDLKEELLETDCNFNECALRAKIKNAIREVIRARNYPARYTDNDIIKDLRCYYPNIRNIALYDYNMIGGEFQTSSSENSVSRSWMEREKLFDGIYAFVKIL